MFVGALKRRHDRMFVGALKRRHDRMFVGALKRRHDRLFVGALKRRCAQVSVGALRRHLATLAAVGGLFVAACTTGGDTSTPVPDDGGPLFDGRTAAEFYGSNCASCHGRNRGGGIGPSIEPGDLTKDDAVYFETIARGRSGSSMPAWRLKGLTDREVDALVAFLRTEP